MAKQDQSQQPNPNDSATDVQEFMQDLDAGMFERKLGIALSQVAASVVDNGGSGEVSIKFTIKRIAGTQQVHCGHALKFTRPTMSGRATEEEERTTPMFVGKFGKLTLAPESQMSLLSRAGDVIQK